MNTKRIADYITMAIYTDWRPHWSGFYDIVNCNVVVSIWTRDIGNAFPLPADLWLTVQTTSANEKPPYLGKRDPETGEWDRPVRVFGTQYRITREFIIDIPDGRGNAAQHVAYVMARVIENNLWDAWRNYYGYQEIDLAAFFTFDGDGLASGRRRENFAARRRNSIRQEAARSGGESCEKAGREPAKDNQD